MSFKPVNMLNPTSNFEPESFDFVWSSCSLEHLTDLEAGMEFIRRSATLLKPGGVAVHTTEFNVLSNDDTLEKAGMNIYRRRDIEEMAWTLPKLGCDLERPDWNIGDHDYDRMPDRVPYFSGKTMHLKVDFDGHIATSMILVIRKNQM